MYLLAVAVTWAAARSTAKSGVVMTACFGRRLVAAQRGADAGQQLVHAERLGDIVVGARVEGGHLVGLGVADRQHDDRDLRPSPEAADDLGAVDVGKPEIEEDDVGMRGRRLAEGLAAGAGEVDVVAARLAD